MALALYNSPCLVIILAEVKFEVNGFDTSVTEPYYCVRIVTAEEIGGFSGDLCLGRGTRCLGLLFPVLPHISRT